MKHFFPFIFIFSLFCSLSARSQNGTVTVIDTSIGDDKVRVPIKDGEWHGVATYQDKKTGIKVAELTYDMGKKTGPATHYDDETGCKKSSGSYVDNAQVGDWLYFKDCSGALSSMVHHEISSDSGYTRISYPSGNTLREGEMKKAKLEGVWTEYYDAPGKLKIIANRCFSKKNGEAVFYDSATQNILAKGSYKCDEKIGRWEYFYPETATMRSFEVLNDDSEFDGPYVKYFMSGNKSEEGFYNNGLASGTFRYYDSATGNVVQMESYVNDTLDGRVQWFYPSGKTDLEGTYVMGVRFGFWKGYYEDGSTRLTVEHEKLTGVGLLKYYARNGKLTSVGKEVDERKEGNWVFYDREGKGEIIKEEAYKDGRRNGETIVYYPGKKVKSKGEYKDDIIDGKWKHYYPSGKLWISAEYAEGRFHDDLKTYYESGKLRRKEKYEQGTILSATCFSETGEEVVYTKLYNEPVYDGDLNAYYRENMVYPEVPLDEDQEGSVTVSVYIHEDGRVEIRQANSGLPAAYEQEALRLVSIMKHWQPATLDGFPTGAHYNITVPFSRVE